MNGKVYVGQTTVSVKRRWSGHLQDAKREGRKYRLHNAILKYGTDAFTIETLAACADKDTLDKLERYFICEVFQSTNDLLGYNIDRGGKSTGRTSESTKAKQRAAMLGRKLKPHSDETKAKIGAIHRGKKMSAESCAKMSKSRRGMKPSEETRAKMSAWQIGRKRPPFSAEARANMGASHKGKKLSIEHRAKIAAGIARRKQSLPPTDPMPSAA